MSLERLKRMRAALDGETGSIDAALANVASVVHRAEEAARRRAAPELRDGWQPKTDERNHQEEETDGSASVADRPAR